MAFKFPFTNYHELNLTWVLEQLKKLFEESEENVETIETYDDRLSTVESEVSTLETTTSQAINTANAAATNAATALSRANTANQNALTASSQAGAAVTTAQESQQEAQAATQTAQQAQATVMTFDGRITQAQNDASAAVQEAQSFENRVNAAINTANNAANTATIAQGVAVNANQTAAQALDELNAQRDELVAISEEQKEAIEETAERVIASIPSDYTQLSEDVKNKAPLIVANASGEIASFKDGADDMEIRHLLATINPIQAGTGDPSPLNVRAISGRTSLSGTRNGVNQWNEQWEVGTLNTNTGEESPDNNHFRTKNPIYVLPNATYYIVNTGYTMFVLQYGADGTYYGYTAVSNQTITIRADVAYIKFVVSNTNSYNGGISINYPATETVYHSGVENQEFSVSWASEAGTIYGGAYDIITGLLTNSDAIIDMGGLTWIKNDSSLIGVPCFYATVPGIKPGVPLAECSSYKVVRDRYVINDNYMIAIGNLSNADYVVVRDDSFASSDAATFKAAVNGVQLVYKRNTPLTYQLDPVTVKTLLSYNNIYTDCGPVSVDYPADTKLYIDGKFTELQALILEH